MPATEADLTNLLNSLGIAFELERHPAIFTVDDNKKLATPTAGGHCKCLFVKDKKSNYALFVVDEDTRVDLKSAQADLGLGRLSFASPERLFDLLGVTPGSVTPFALINLKSDQKIKVVLDSTMMEKSPLHYHPLHNEATVALSNIDLLRFITHLGIKPIIYDF